MKPFELISKSLRVAIISASVLMPGCGKATDAQNAGGGSEVSASKLPADAQKFLEESLAVWIPQRGESRFSKFQYSGGSYYFSGGVVCEWSKPTLVFEHFGNGGANLTETDKLNGVVEWWRGKWNVPPRRFCLVGYAGYNADYKELTGNYQKAKWSAWGQGMEQFNGVKANGQPYLSVIQVIRKADGFSFHLEGGNSWDPELNKWKANETSFLPK